MRLQQIIREHGLTGAAIAFVERRLGLKIPLPPRLRWRTSMQTEISFWEDYFRTRGEKWPGDYQRRLDPDAEVEDDIAQLLSRCESLKVLDVGAGPLTILGKKWQGRAIELRAVDPLAPHYDRILRRHGVEPVVRTEAASAERLTEVLEPGSFDLVFAQNCIDHAYNPETAILEMIKLAKPGHYVYLKHSQNEAEKEGWFGLHQWNLSRDNGDFVISSHEGTTNFSSKYSHLGEMTCTVDEEIDMVMLVIRKATV
jgi:SAM-dependent methyltransferase